MILNKRISKFRPLAVSSQEGSENPKPSAKAEKTPRCRFKQIPQNNKFAIAGPLYPLLGVSVQLYFFYAL